MNKKIFDELTIIVKKHKPNINLNERNLDVTLKSLNIDSLDAISIIVDLEKKLNTRINEDSLVNLHTLSDLIDIFDKQIK